MLLVFAGVLCAFVTFIVWCDIIGSVFHFVFQWDTGQVPFMSLGTVASRLPDSPTP